MYGIILKIQFPCFLPGLLCVVILFTVVSKKETFEVEKRFKYYEKKWIVFPIEFQEF